MTEGPAPILDPDFANRVASLSVMAQHIVDGHLTGMHRSPHRGASVVFAEHQDYRPGDDTRRIDWKASARMDRQVLKRFELESQLRALLLLDGSGSMAFAGSGGGPTKHTYAASILAALSHLLIRQGDAVGIGRFHEDLLEILPPASKPSHLTLAFEHLAKAPDPDRPTNLHRTILSLADRTTRRHLLVFATDLIDPAEDPLAPLGPLVARGHEVWVLHVLTPDELSFPFDGMAIFEGLEGEAAVEASAENLRPAYIRAMEQWLRNTQAQCTAIGVRHVLARTDEPPEGVLGRLLGRD
ncbi:MAG: DUF58 domain-containing protein [Myxococcales bacterium]|nr:DUF58 domain-containing protein [Myxococcales bacterium]